jgi:hypothetical protein
LQNDFVYFQEMKKPQIVMHLTKLDLLTHEALHPGNKTKEIENKISDFLSDEAIVNRTQNCQEYFEKHITARAFVKRGFNVSWNGTLNT